MLFIFHEPTLVSYVAYVGAMLFQFLWRDIFGGYTVLFNEFWLLPNQKYVSTVTGNTQSPYSYIVDQGSI